MWGPILDRQVPTAPETHTGASAASGTTSRPTYFPCRQVARPESGLMVTENNIREKYNLFTYCTIQVQCFFQNYRKRGKEKKKKKGETSCQQSTGISEMLYGNTDMLPTHC